MGLYKRVLSVLDLDGVNAAVTKAVIVDCDDEADAARLDLTDSGMKVTRLSPTRLLVELAERPTIDTVVSELRALPEQKRGPVAAPSIDTVMAALRNLPEAQREELRERLEKMVK